MIKKLIPYLLLFLLVFIGPAAAETVEVFDWQSGTYRTYDVQTHGGQTTIFDYQTGTYIDGTHSDGNSSYYDYETNSYYDMDQTGEGSYTGFDYNTGTYQDYQVDDNGSVEVFDYENGEFYYIE